jgi:hypothetical protein
MLKSGAPWPQRYPAAIELEQVRVLELEKAQARDCEYGDERDANERESAWDEL